MIRHDFARLLRIGCCAALLAVPSTAQHAVSNEAQNEAQNGAQDQAQDADRNASDPLIILGTSAPDADRPEPAAAERASLAVPATAAPVLDTALHQQGFGAAVEAYRKGAYAEARDLFGLLAAGEPDPQRRAMLHANAGTAAARSDALGLAVWHLEAALRCAPRDATARRNLDQVRARLGQASLSAASFTESLLRLPLWLAKSESEQLLGGLAALALALLCLRRRAPRFALRAALIVGIVGLASWQALEQARARDLKRAVVVADAQVRAEPRGEGKLLFRLETGTVVRSEEQRGDWRLIETDAGGRGWAPGNSIKLAGF